MKNFESILADAGIELTEEQKEKVTKAMKENYKPIADYNNQKEKVENLEEQLQTTKDALAKFDGVDADALNQKIKDLTADLEKKDTEYQEKIADRDFNDMLKESISAAKGKNAKAITALLDVEALKASKNQKEDVDNAIKALTEAEDSKMLFGDAEPSGTGTGAPIGSFGSGATGDADIARMRAAMGLPETKGDK